MKQIYLRKIACYFLFCMLVVASVYAQDCTFTLELKGSSKYEKMQLIIIGEKVNVIDGEETRKSTWKFVFSRQRLSSA